MAKPPGKKRWAGPKHDDSDNGVTVEQREEWKDSDRFYVPPRDARGQSDRIQLRVPPDIVRMTDKIIAGGQFPYQTSADLWRHGLFRHQGYLADLKHAAIPRGLWSTVQLITDGMRNRDLNEMATEVLGEQLVRIAAMAREGHSIEARLEAKLIHRHVIVMVDGPARSRLLVRLRAELGEYL